MNERARASGCVVDIKALLSEAADLLAMGRFGDAAAACREALAIAPDHIEARLRLGDALLAGSDAAGAMEAWRGLLAGTPEYVPANLRLGILLARSGDGPGALACFGRVLVRRPEHAGAHRACADVHFERGEFAEAIHHYRLALETQHDQPEILDRLHAAERHLAHGGATPD